MAVGAGGIRGGSAWSLDKRACVLQYSLLAALTFLLSGCGHDQGSTTTTTSGSGSTTSGPASTTTVSVPAESFKCDSGGKEFTELVRMGKKGLAVDDNTLKGCAGKIPYFWPNTKEVVGSIRLFTPWRPDFGDDKAKETAWANVISYLTKTGAQVLVGTDATCNQTADDAQWEDTLAFMKRLKEEKITIQGVAFGNEMDILNVHGAPETCLHKLWELGGFQKTVTARVKDLDDNGFSDLPVTTVWSAGILVNQPFMARVLPFMKAMDKQYAKRWVWSATVYAIWNIQLMPKDCDPIKKEKDKKKCMAACEDAIDEVANMTRYNANQVADFRQRIRTLTGENRTFWVAETGWSSPVPKSISGISHCKNYTSAETFNKYYSNFLAWNLDKVKDATGTREELGPDHIFYFTIRDSANFEDEEHFGLVRSCNETKCKIQPTTATAGDESALGGYTHELTI